MELDFERAGVVWRVAHELTTPRAWPLEWLLRALLAHPLIRGFLRAVAQTIGSGR